MFLIVFVAFIRISLINGLQNLALGKDAYQKDTYYSHVAGRSVDGVTTQNLPDSSCSNTWSVNGAWWEVDLGDTYNIDNVKIYNRMDCCSDRLADVQLYIGYGHNDYVLRGYHPGAIGSTYTFQMTSNVYGLWIRITRVVGLENSFLCMCEVQVYGNNTRKMRLQLVSNLIGTGNVLQSQTTTSSIHCCLLCKATSRCAGVNYSTMTGTCELLETTSSVTDTTSNTYFYKYP